jgi:hypothetical protein
MNLFPHNKEAYESAVKLFKQENRVCIIRPTGTGKSVIIAEFVNQYPTKRHLLLAPGTHIFNEILKHIRKGKISSSTYIGLKQKAALFKPDSFDYIYLDEFHRLGAEVWGSAVGRLLMLNPNAKVLGTSATHIRYLDDNRNMALEIFNDRIAAQMSLNSAIANGILPTPIYVSALYSIREEFRQLKKKILASNSENTTNLVRDLDSKVIDWERSSGLDVVLKRHLHDNRRRVIVFCKDWDHLKYAQKILAPVFHTIYGSVENLSLYSKKKESDNESALDLFKGEDPRAVILYTIDKVNEGLHSKNCNTVILLRDTISPIVFYQQIGRAFSVKPANRPLIIDLVNNFKNVQLNSFKNDFEHEWKTSTKKNRTANEEKIKAAIEFIDEVQDIKEVFSSFEGEIDEWKRFYEKAKTFFNEHAHLYVSPANRELLEWVRNQRKAYQGGKMGIKRADQLRAIGMEFGREIPARWMTIVWEIEEWKRKNGVLPGIRENSRLYTWMVRQRQDYRKGTLSAAQVNILKDLIRLEEDTRVKERVERLVRHFEDGKGTVTNEIRHDLQLIKILFQKGRLPKTLLAQLKNAKVPIEGSINDHTWFRKVKKVLSNYKESGIAPASKSPLYNFCIRERRYLGKRHPSEKFIKRDKEAKLAYDSFKELIGSMGAPDWDDQCEKLRLFAETNGRVTNAGCDTNLLEWMWRQRRFIRDGKLSAEKTKKLLEIKEIDWYSHRQTQKA